MFTSLIFNKGHGGKVKDDDKNEEIDGYDETLYPVDYNNIGIIRDDDILTTLVLPMAKGMFWRFINIY